MDMGVGCFRLNAYYTLLSHTSSLSAFLLLLSLLRSRPLLLSFSHLFSLLLGFCPLSPLSHLCILSLSLMPSSYHPLSSLGPLLHTHFFWHCGGDFAFGLPPLGQDKRTTPNLPYTFGPIPPTTTTHAHYYTIAILTAYLFPALPFALPYHPATALRTFLLPRRCLRFGAFAVLPLLLTFAFCLPPSRVCLLLPAALPYNLSVMLKPFRCGCSRYTAMVLLPFLCAWRVTSCWVLPARMRISVA